MRPTTALLRVGVLLALGACAADSEKTGDEALTESDPGATGGDSSPSGNTPSAWDPDDYLGEQSAQDGYDQAAFEAALAEGLATLVSLQPGPVIDAYDEAMADQEAYCPAYYEVDGNVFWYSSCTTSSGTWYDGYGFDYVYEDAVLDESGNLWDMRQISGAATIRDASGNTFHLGGALQLGESVTADGWEIHLNVVQGSFAADSAVVDDTWLAQGVAPYHYVYAATYPSLGGGGEKYMYAQSSIGNINEDGLSIMVPDLLIGTSGLGWPCEAEPSGSIAARMPDGAWFEVHFDVVEDARGNWSVDGACDGCGDVVDATGETVGQACIDSAPMLSWEVSPWDG